MELLGYKEVASFGNKIRGCMHTFRNKGVCEVRLGFIPYFCQAGRFYPLFHTPPISYTPYFIHPLFHTPPIEKKRLDKNLTVPYSPARS